MERMHIQDVITLIAGVALVAAPFVLGITPPEGTAFTPLMANFVIAGAAAIILGAAALFYFRIWKEWLDIALGFWLVASPWILGFTNAQMAMWTAIACGMVIAVMGIWRTAQEDSARGY